MCTASECKKRAKMGLTSQLLDDASFKYNPARRSAAPRYRYAQHRATSMSRRMTGYDWTLAPAAPKRGDSRLHATHNLSALKFAPK